MASSFPMKKNTATTIVFPILDADGDLVTGATAPDSEYSLDGAGFIDCAAEISEIGTSGIYSLALAAGETNGDVVCIQVKTTSSGAKTSVLVFYTAAQTLDDIEGLVDDIGVAGAGLTAIPWNAAWDAEVESEATDALNAYDPPTNAEMVARTLATASYALEATLTTITGLVDDLENRLTAARAGYLDNLSAGAVALEATLTAIKGAGWATETLKAIKDETATILVDTGTTLQNEVDGIQADTENIQTRLPAALVGGRMDSDIGAKTGNVALSAQEKLDVNTQADTALTDYDPPTNAEMVARTLAAASYALEATVAALNNLSAAGVNAEMVDVLATDTQTEPTGVPAATASLVNKIGVLYMMARNQIDVTVSKKTFYGDDGVAEFEKDLSDNGVVYTETETNAI